MPKVASEKRSEKNGWGNGQLFGGAKDESSFTGGGFKDKEKALETIRLMEGRDTTYQYQVINSMYNRAKVILKRTTDKEKRQNLNEAVDTFESWIDDYKAKSRSKENFSYLTLELALAFKPLASKYEIDDFDFLDVFGDAEGDLKKLRVLKVKGKEVTWDVERNRRLKEINENMNANYIPFYETDEPLRGLPTKEHTQMIILGYTSDQSKLKNAYLFSKRNFIKDIPSTLYRNFLQKGIPSNHSEKIL